MSDRVSRMVLASGAPATAPGAWGVRPVAAQDDTQHQGASAAPSRALARTVSWAWLGAGLLVWTVSYLLRQPEAGAVLASAPVAGFLVEGMLLALTWLGLIVAGCLAMLSGAIEIRLPGDDR